MTVSKGIRSELARFCKSRKTRKNKFSPTLPTDWAPQHVTNPVTNEAFTPDGAWEFVAGLLEAGHEIQTIVLKIPPGKKGYVLIVDGVTPQKIYIKLQIGSGFVIGRSFHISIQKGNLS